MYCLTSTSAQQATTLANALRPKESAKRVCTICSKTSPGCRLNLIFVVVYRESDALRIDVEAIALLALMLISAQKAWSAVGLYETGAPGSWHRQGWMRSDGGRCLDGREPPRRYDDARSLTIASRAMLPSINFDRGAATKVLGGGGGAGNAGVFFFDRRSLFTHTS